MTAGRPPKSDSTLSKDRILATALAVLDEGGQEALSFRILAKRLGVTPMAIAHHVGSRHQMLTGLIAQVYDGIAVPPEGDVAPEACVRLMLERYCGRVVAHPQIAQLIFADQSLFAGHVVALTDVVRTNIAALVSDPQEVDLLVDLIVDYTHGFAISAAANHTVNAQTPNADDYLRGLDWILVRLQAPTV
ncbi:MAG: TetR/AcrR family transcriptional regulator [Alphaproteobacteria bacterium]|nr:TetR/AcrR family transcriptional regulator [Alphaproteobacteria bacterium]